MNSNTNSFNQLNSVSLISIVTSKPTTSQRFKVETEALRFKYNVTGKKAWVSGQVFPTKGTHIGECVSIINNTSKKIRELCLPCATIKGRYYARMEDLPRIEEIFMAGHIKLENAKRGVADNWNTLVAQGKLDLGMLADQVDYPAHPYKFVSEYRMEFEISSAPAPIRGTVLQNCSTEAAARIRAISERTAKKHLVESQKAPLKELIDILAESVTQIRHGKRLRDDRFKLIQDSANKLKKLNIIESTAIDSLVASVTSDVAQVTSASDLTKEERATVASNLDKKKTMAEQALAGLGF